MATEAGDTVYNPNSLIIRGPAADPSIPEGFIKVNDQLQRSQAAPQPLPWWIAQADEEAQRRRDRDELQAQINAQQQATSVQAARGIERAMQLEGTLGFDADRKRGVPIQEALMKWAPKMYFKNPATVAGIARSFAQSQPFTPTETTVGGQRLIQVSPRQFRFPPQQQPAVDVNAPIPAVEVRSPSGEVLGHAVRGSSGAIHPISKTKDNQQLSPSQKLQVLRTQLTELNKQMDNAIGDPESMKSIKAQHDIVMEAISELSPSKSKAAAAPAKQSAPDKSEARKEAESLIKSRPRIADQVRARFKQTYGEDL